MEKLLNEVLVSKTEKYFKMIKLLDDGKEKYFKGTNYIDYIMFETDKYSKLI